MAGDRDPFLLRSTPPRRGRRPPPRGRVLRTSGCVRVRLANVCIVTWSSPVAPANGPFGHLRPSDRFGRENDDLKSGWSGPGNQREQTSRPTRACVANGCIPAVITTDEGGRSGTGHNRTTHRRSAAQRGGDPAARADRQRCHSRCGGSQARVERADSAAQAADDLRPARGEHADRGRCVGGPAAAHLAQPIPAAAQERRASQASQQSAQERTPSGPVAATPPAPQVGPCSASPRTLFQDPG
jgi:hypothetical protein